MTETEIQDAKVAEFKATVLQDAGAEADGIVARAIAARDVMLEETRALYQKKAKQQLEDAGHTHERERMRRVSRQSYMSGQAVLKKREQLVNEFFSGIENKLQSFTDSPAYETFLAKVLRFAAKQAACGDFSGAEVFARAADVKAIKGILGGKAVVTASPSIKLGGIALTLDSRVYIDLTLDYALKNERARFANERHELSATTR